MAFFVPKTVDSVLGHFTKAIEDLREIADFHARQIEKKEAEAARLVEEAEIALEEHTRAANAASNLDALYKSLLGGASKDGSDPSFSSAN